MRSNRRMAIANLPLYASDTRFPPLQPLPRCRCGRCAECLENERWDRIFARFEAPHSGDVRGVFQSTLSGL